MSARPARATWLRLCLKNKYIFKVFLSFFFLCVWMFFSAYGVESALSIEPFFQPPFPGNFKVFCTFTTFINIIFYVVLIF